MVILNNALDLRRYYVDCFVVAHLFKAFLYTGCATSKTEHEPQRRRANRASDLRHTQAHFATITTRCNRLPFGLCVPFPTRQKLRFHLSYSHISSLVFDVREPLCVCSTSDCAMLLRSRRTKRSGTIREIALVMSRPSVVPRHAVAVGSLLRGNGNGENT